MRLTIRLLIPYFVAIALLDRCYCDDFYNDSYKWPTIVISVLVRNKEDTLPYFLTCLHQLDYPKDRLFLWIHSDYNTDSSVKVIEEWRDKYAKYYRKVNIMMDPTEKQFGDQVHKHEWTPQRYRHVINLREEAFKTAKDSWADYIFMLDADVFLSNNATLKLLVMKDQLVVAPMLITDGLYSNFWGDMTENYYYKRSDDYEDIFYRKETGCFNVPMVHSAVLISLRQGNSDNLTYDPKKLEEYDGPHDDVITFANSAKRLGINLTLCNDEIYGFVTIPLDDESNNDAELVDNVKLEALSRGVILPVDPVLEKYVKTPTMTKFGLNEIFLINLERREERKELMIESFKVLGMEAKIVKAVDGKTLTEDKLKKLNIHFLPNYQDPYNKRPMKTGEVGCFLSHYGVWKEIAQRNLGQSLILEDDAHFVPFFRDRFEVLLSELKLLDWDLVYIGRKRLMQYDEEFVSDHVVVPHYSYWTLGYLLSEAGARKLIKAEPLTKMLPVDEFLPIMFDQHPNSTWKKNFPVRDLKAFSAQPLLVYPTHYTDGPGYISDTEDSTVVSSEKPTRKHTSVHGNLANSEL